MPKENGTKMEERDEKGRFVDGHSGGPGRPKGSLNFATKFKQAIEALAEQNNITGDKLEEQIVQMAIKKAREGDYQYYRDIMDRVYGKPQQSIDHTSGGKEMPTPILGNAYVHNDDSHKENNADAIEDSCLSGGHLSIEDDKHTPLFNTLSTERRQADVN